jgi:hypothetical protein
LNLCGIAADEKSHGSSAFGLYGQTRFISMPGLPFSCLNVALSIIIIGNLLMNHCWHLQYLSSEDRGTIM